jgi:hypothetical protein
VELYKVICNLVRKYDIRPQSLTHMWKEEQMLFLYKTHFNITISHLKEGGIKAGDDVPFREQKEEED